MSFCRQFFFQRFLAFPAFFIFLFLLHFLGPEFLDLPLAAAYIPSPNAAQFLLSDRLSSLTPSSPTLK